MNGNDQEKKQEKYQEKEKIFEMVHFDSIDLDSIDLDSIDMSDSINLSDTVDSLNKNNQYNQYNDKKDKDKKEEEIKMVHIKDDKINIDKEIPQNGWYLFTNMMNSYKWKYKNSTNFYVSCDLCSKQISKNI